MNLRIENAEDFKVLHVAGEINTSSTEELDIFLEENVSDTDFLKIDFEEVSLITSAGLRVLMKLEKSIKRRGRLVLINVPDSVYHIFEMTGLTKVFIIEACAEDNEPEPEIEPESMAGAETTEAADENEQDELTPCVTIEFSEAEIDESCLAELPKRVQENLRGKNPVKVLLWNNLQVVGYLIYESDEDEARILYLFINPEEREKGYATEALKQLGSYLTDGEISRIILAGVSQEEVHRLAKRAAYRLLDDKMFVIRYSVEQIAESKLYSKIEKLRPMFNSVHFVNELDAIKRLGMEMQYGILADELDPVFARVYEMNGEVIGILDAQEKSDGEIWVDRIVVAPKKEAEMSIVLMFASMFDASYLMLSPDNEISIAAKKTVMVKAFETILGEPMEMIEECVYQMEI